MGPKGHYSLLPIPDQMAFVSLIVISLLAVLGFHTSINGGFVFDDMEAVINNNDIKLTTPLSNIFSNDFWGTKITHNGSHKSYRPLTILAFRLNVLASGGNVVALHFHVVNLALYAAVCCLSFFVLENLCGAHSRRHVTFAAAVLFTVHPVHTESVAPVVGCADLLCALFMFSAFLVYTSVWNRRSNLVLNVICTTLTIILASMAMFAKEQGITILGICGMYDILILYKLHPQKLLHWKTWTAEKSMRLFTRQVILLVATITLMSLRWWIMGGTVPVFQKVDNPASYIDNVYFRVINYIYIYALNVWLLICPEWLCYDWSMGCVPLIESFSDIRIVSVVLFSSLFGLLIISLLRKTSGANRQELLMALSFTILPFIPASNIFFRVGFVIAERTLLVPSLGFCLLIIFGIQHLCHYKIWRMIVNPLLVMLIVVFCARSHMRTSQWTSERELFLSALSVCPLNAKVHYNLAKSTSNHTEAMKNYKEALRLNPTYDQAMNNLANILKDLGKLSEAEKLLRQAVKLRPDFAAAWMNLGIVLSHQKQFSEEAELCYKTAISHRRKYPDCYYNLGNLYLELKDHSKAYESWRQATSFEPRHHGAWNNLIIMLDSIGKHEEACSVGLEALAVLPNSSAIHFNIANAKGKLNQFIDAENHFKAAIKLRSDYPLYYVNLGVLYHHWKKFGLAKEMYRLALQLDPNLKSAKENLRLLED